MDNIVKDLLSVKWLICVFLFKDLVFLYFMWALYRRNKITHYKIVGVDKGKAIKIMFEQRNAERGKK